MCMHDTLNLILETLKPLYFQVDALMTLHSAERRMHQRRTVRAMHGQPISLSGTEWNPSVILHATHLWMRTN